MSLELEPHNQEAYEKVKEIFEQSNKAAVVHPTGTGKSYIALKLIENNQGKKVIYLAPSKSILHKIKDAMVENGIKFREDDKKYVERFTYQKLTSLYKNDKLDMDADIIILDEFHHGGAPIWGKAIEQLLSNNPNAKVLGLSATPMRYFDEEIRDMAEELFGENIASEMSLEEAISMGILSKPQYTTGIYEAEEIIREKEESINNIPDGENKQLAQKELEELKRLLSASVQGLPELLRDNMTEKSGKYLIYCKNIEDMEKKIAEAEEMFGLVNEEMEIMSVSSKKSETENMNEIRRFEKKSNSEKLKLLFSVDMLNEGYHLKELDGVIMMRPTHSPTLYDQQLGRALSVGANKTPIIIDLVNNIDTIEIIENFGKRVRENSGENNSISIKGFTISEELRKIQDVIAKIDSLVQRRKVLSQEEKLALMKRYIEETGEEIKIDTQFEGYNIGIMKNNLRALYNQGTLKIDENLLKEFIELGIIVEEKERIRTTPQEKFEFLMEALKKSPEELENFTMKSGLTFQKVKNQIQIEYNKGTLRLEPEQIEMLKNNGILGFSKSEKEALAEQYNLPQKYIVDIIQKYGSFEEFLDKYKRHEIEYEFGNDVFVGSRTIIMSENDITEEEKLMYSRISNPYQDNLRVICIDGIKDILEDMKSSDDKTARRRVQAIEMLYGLTDGKKYSREEVAKILGCSRSTIDNYEHKVCSIIYQKVKKYNIKEMDKQLEKLEKEQEDIEDYIKDWEIIKSIITRDDGSLRDIEEIKDIKLSQYGFSGKILHKDIKVEDDIDLEELTIVDFLKKREEYEGKIQADLDMPIEELDFSIRAVNQLSRVGIYTLGDLLSKTEREIMHIRNLGKKTFDEIKEKVEARGYTLINEEENEEKNISNISKELKDSMDLDMPIEELDFSIRAFCELKRAGIYTLGDLLSKTEREIMNIRNLGTKGFDEIKEKVEARGYTLINEEENEEKNISNISKELKSSIYLYMPIEELDFSVRTFHCLERVGVKTLYDLLLKTEREIGNTRNLGTKGFDEIKEKLNSMGLKLDEEGFNYTEKDLLKKYKFLSISEENTNLEDITEIDKILEICNANLSKYDEKLESLKKPKKELEEIVRRLHIAQNNYLENEELFNPNGIVHGIPSENIEQLQKTQNEEIEAPSIQTANNEEIVEEKEEKPVEIKDNNMKNDENKRKTELIESIERHQQELEMLKIQLAELENSKDIKNNDTGVR